jgi:hypothetical protein
MVKLENGLYEPTSRHICSTDKILTGIPFEMQPLIQMMLLDPQHDLDAHAYREFSAPLSNLLPTAYALHLQEWVGTLPLPVSILMDYQLSLLAA